MNYKRLESMFRKKHTPHIHAHPPWHTHAHHAHIRDSMYTNVYTCAHCDRTSHLAKFYYDRSNAINFANKNVWVRKGANPMDSRKFGYQNSFLFHLMQV